MAGYGCTMPVLWTLLVFLAVNTVRSEVLTPPYFNLAEGRRIESTSTCGEGVQEKELYCRLTGANTEEVGERPDNILQGQLCDYCDPRDANRKHPITQATDGTQKWWQSPPLSRGAEFNEVNITIDLGQEFHVAYVFMKMGNAPRPGVWVLERSKDNGVSWDPWQYFADSPGDCLHFFNLASNEPITEDDSVICTTEFSKVIPLEGGEIVISLVNNRPNAMNFSHSKELQEFTEATNVRLRLLRSKTLLGHLLAVARQDPTVTRRYFYSIKDISIGGRCVCNGHANVCDKTDPRDPYKLLCRCQHNTCGAQCDTCCTDYVQKKWRRATEEDSYVCEACNCHGHSEQCEYDADVDTKSMSLDISGQYIGGGVCQNCRDYTEGINCEKCISGFYRPEGRLRNETDACTRCRCDPRVSTGACSDVTGQCECRDNFAGVNCDECAYGYYAPPHCYPCDCYANGTIDAVCYPEQGQCPCRYNYGGATCDRCAQGFFDFPHCTPCNCSQYGSLDEICDEVSGQCKCSGVFTDRACDRCREGTWNYPHCEYCQCDLAGVTPEICNDETGRCLCLDGFNSANCGRCAAGFYGFPDCQECTCDPVGSEGDACAVTGQCRCKPNFSGPKCGLCASGFYSYPDCLPCDCDLLGAHGASCNDQGQCICRGNFEGLHCDRCRENFYNYPLCEACNCHPAGVSDSFGGCDTVAEGQLCECKERVTGRICDECKSLFWNLQHNNREGCQDCDCWEPGTLSGYSSCDGETGQCLCKPYVTSRRCDQCQPGTYKLLENNLFGCESCMCDAGGALNAHCDTVTGQCLCRPRVSGRACDYPHTNHFFPTLFQHQFEIEDGRTPSGSLVRFAYHDDVFPGYSWRGYAIFSQTQPDVLMDIEVDKPSLYLIVYHYVNRGSKTINGQVIVTSEYDDETTTVQKGTLELLPSTQPSFTSVKVGGTDYPFVLDPGRWTVTTSIPDLVDAVFLDYFVLLPQVYYEATLLQEHIYAPCSLDAAAGATCLHYVYPPLAQYPRARGETGYVGVNNERMRVQQLEDEHVLTALDSPSMAWLSNNQTSMFLDLVTDAPGEYLLLINYYMTERGRMDTLAVDVATPSGPQQGKALLYDCNYRSLCRSVVLDLEGRAAVYAVDTDYISLTLQGSIDIDAAIDSVVAIPIKDWTEMLYTPQVRCLRKDGECEESSFPLLPSAVRYEVEAGVNADRRVPDIEMIADVYDKDIGLVYMSENEGALEVQGTVSRPGTYSFVSHHYQPKHSEFSLDVIVDNGYHVYEAVLPVPYCGSLSGCRSLVETGSRDFQFEVQENFTLSFQVAGRKSLWMDYVLVIPSTDQRPDFNAKGMVDKASDFIQECAKDHFYVDPSRQGFCRDAVFSLTTEYNNGALQCGCNIDGSLSFQCEEFGGRCICKDNVIGRICSQCHPGYYGFPNCQKCNCPNGICEQDTGKCICPPNVAGPQCNVCLPETFGYDPFIGCEECACEYYGVEDRNMTCDLITGKCRCKENVVGRQCTDCMVGSYAYPHCVDCTCSRYGVTRDVCDQTNGDCICKDNVEGARCDQCAPGSYYLHPDNEKGCTSCFCFGVTKACASSELVVVYIMDMRDWNVTNLENPLIDDASNLAYNDPTLINVRVRESRPIDPDAASYFVAPAPYLGDKVTSYGGRLTYSVAHTPADQDAYRIIQGDVIITGNNISVVHTSMDQPEPELSTHISVALVESSFVLADDAAHQVAVTREQFMMVLADVTSLHIRATYYSATQDSMIANVSLPIGIVGGAETEGHDLDQAHSVEQCQCPRNYEGSSCEVCAEGYHRVDEGPYLGHCVPCNCYGHAETCDRNTGECVDCRNNTVGANCDRCELGYYGDATQGSEWDCQICACPLPTVANNFAASCTPLEDGFEVTCVCLEGYKGVNCEMCAAGYWGDPTEPGGACVRCECNDNLDLSTPEPCDTATGECLSCGNDTGGPACSRCVPGYYGDAIIAKNCVRCSCDACGTEECDFDTGSCRCAAGVEGVACDRCQRNMYGFSSCEGCTHCNCSEASMSSQCDAETGDCECQPGVRGRTCDTCKNGYWNFSPFGCQKCDCENFVDTGTICDQATGQCKCLPGVTGDKCDTCDEKWVFIENVGCQPCDVCTHILIDDVAWLETNVSGVMDELANVSIGVYAYARLRRDQDRVDALRPLVGGIVTDPSQVNLRPLQQDMNGLEQYANHVRDTADGTVAESDDVNEKVMVVKERAVAVEMMMRETVAEAHESYKVMQQLRADILQGVSSYDASAILAHAERVLDIVRMANFSSSHADTADELAMAEMVMDAARNLSYFIAGLDARCIDDKNDTDALHALLREMMTHSLQAAEQTRLARHKNDANRNNPIQENVDQIEANVAMIDEDVSSAEKLIEEAIALLEEARDSYETVASQQEDLEPLREPLEEKSSSLKAEEDLASLVNDSLSHADMLEKQAQQLAEMTADATEPANNAIHAANAYVKIVTSVEDALAAAEAAFAASHEAQNISGGLADQTQESRNRSLALLADARRAELLVSGRLADSLQASTDAVDAVAMTTEEAASGVAQVRAMVEMIAADQGFGASHEAANDKAVHALWQVDTTNDRIEGLLEEVPAVAARADTLATEIQEADRSVDRTRNQVDRVKSMVPQTDQMIPGLWERKSLVNQLGVDVGEKIRALRDLVEQAREKADSIKLGMKFNAATTLHVRNPKHLGESPTHGVVSLYFRTTKANALLVYMGTGGGHQGEHHGEAAAAAAEREEDSEDFVALEIVGGKCVMRFELGAGVASISNDKLVNDAQWHEVIAERTGKTATLTVRTDGEDNVIAEGTAPGQFTSLNLDPETSVVYVGGASDTVSLPAQVANRRYTGCIESVSFNKQPLPLWNFVHAENLFEACKERDQLQVQQGASGYKFDGSGYVVVARGDFNPQDSADVTLEFRSFADAGLLIYGGKNRDFLALELIDGAVLFQYDMGSGRAQIRTNATYNDGAWHTVNARRFGREGLLLVDGEEAGSGVAPGSLTKLDIGDDVYIGGTLAPPTLRDVTARGLEGCIRNVQLGTTIVDMSINKDARGIVAGCPDTIVRVASFDGAQGSYTEHTDVTFGEQAALTFKFRTLQPTSLVMYAADAGQTHALSAQLLEGRVAVVHTSDDLSTVLQSNNNNYNDGEWHFVNILKDAGRLHIDIDEGDRKDQELSDAGPDHQAALWMAGVPTDYGITEGASLTLAAFSGCLGDITVNSKRINFIDVPAEKRPGAQLEHCPLDVETTTQTFGPTTEAPHGPCVLPLRPGRMSSSMLTSPGAGKRFGSTPTSRQEYATLPDKFKHRSKFEFEFKTDQPDGVIFYMADARHIDYMAVYMQAGALHFDFNCGSGSARLVSSKLYNNNTWHIVKFNRKFRQGELQVDSELAARAKSKGNARSLNVNPPFSIGGLSSDLQLKAAKNIDVTRSLSGCVRNFKLNNLPLDDLSAEEGVEPCADNVEPGTFFSIDGGHLILSDNFKVGLDLDLQLEIKPRSMDGMIMYVSASTSTDFLALQLVNGNLTFSVDNGAGIISATYSPAEATGLCDGSWHSVQAVKAKNLVTLSVDGVFVKPGIGQIGISSADTNDPLYIGGIPDAPLPGVLTQSQFVGCIRDVYFNQKIRSLADASELVGTVTLNSCPTT